MASGACSFHSHDTVDKITKVTILLTHVLQVKNIIPKVGRRRTTQQPRVWGGSQMTRTACPRLWTGVYPKWKLGEVLVLKMAEGGCRDTFFQVLNPGNFLSLPLPHLQLLQSILSLLQPALDLKK